MLLAFFVHNAHNVSTYICCASYQTVYLLESTASYLEVYVIY